MRPLQLVPALVALVALATSLPACSGPAEGGPDAGVPELDGGAPPDARPIDPCDPNPCTEANRTACEAPLGVPECRCDAGYELLEGRCERATTCTETTCSGHGECSMGEGGPGCACALGFAGERCERCDDAAGYYDDGRGGCTLDACTPSPCTDPTRALCAVVDRVAVCSCNAGTHEEGGVCVPDATCTATSCAGHGVCTMADGATSCACDEGWGGARCDACDSAAGYHADGAGGCTRDRCLPNPCTAPRRSVCTSDGATTSCGCDPGSHLEIDTCVIDAVCAPHTCSMHGTCAVIDGRTQCTCAEGWSGSACDACAEGWHDDGAGGCTTDVCLPNPCTAPDQTTCVAMGATPTCTCDPGAHPDGTGGCTTDPCLPDPCVAANQACRVIGASYECYVPPCDDGNACTTDAVVGGTCVHTVRANGTSCSTDICTVGQTCSAGVCGGGSARACDDGNPCTRDTCASPAGCIFTDDDTLVPPDDAFSCTVGRCSAGSAEHVPLDARCDDGRWCTGEDVCSPGAGADPRGCVVRDVPVAPGPSTPCAFYACSDAMGAFTRTVLPTGSSCDDGIACTTGDSCDASSVCAGTVTPLCEPGTASCTPSGSLVTSVDIGVAPITGTITQNGAPLPLTTPAYENGVIWARARDTGVLHRLALIDWARGSYPSYTRTAESDRIRTTLIPGVYDVLYQRAYQSSGDYVSSQTHLTTGVSDPVVNGYRLVQSGVVIPAGGRTLDVDIGATAITGTITQGGATLPTTTPSYENGVIWARARDTGKLHRLALIDWARGSYPSYTRSAGSDQIRTMLVPGRYDILYQRAYQSSGDYVSSQTHLTTGVSDPVVNGYRVLQENVAIGGASQVVNVDIGVTTITGTITQGGATLPTTTPAYENGVIWARARDTGKLHRLALIDWARGSYPSYMRSAGSDQIRTILVPGRYDILYQRAYQSSGDYVSSQTHLTTGVSDPVVNGYRLLQADVVIAGTTQVVNVDIGVTAITGTITQGGATLPTTTPAYENGVIWARARDTGKLHRLALIDWARGSYPSYMRSAGSDQIRTMLVPGSYDILYQRAYQSSGDYVSSQTHLTTGVSDPVVNGYRVLRENVIVSGAAQVIDVDVGVTAITGTITQDGAPLPTTTPTYENGVIWARARDTGKLHRLALIDWARGSYPSYMRSAGSDQIRTMLLPGSYDILYQRAYQSSGDYVSSQTHLTTGVSDPVVNGYRVLREDVVVSGASQVIDVDITSVIVAGTITMNGEALPMTTPAYENGVLWLRARDTGIRHRLALIDWARGSYPSYTRSATSDRFSSTMTPGAYDLLYQRAYQSSGEYVSSQTHLTTGVSDPVVNGYRVLQACVLVESTP